MKPPGILLILLICNYGCGKKTMKEQAYFQDTIHWNKHYNNLYQQIPKNTEYPYLDSSENHEQLMEDVELSMDGKKHFVYVINQPHVNFKRLIKVTKPSHIFSWLVVNKFLEWDSTETPIRIYFAPRIKKLQDLTYDYNIIKAMMLGQKMDYLIVQENGICVGTYSTAISFNKFGGMVAHICLAWDWGYDGSYYEGKIVEEINDSVIIQEVRESNDYTLGDGVLAQTLFMKQQITFQSDGTFKLDTLEWDTLKRVLK